MAILDGIFDRSAEEAAARDGSTAEVERPEPDPQHAAKEAENPNVSKTKTISKTKTGKIVMLFLDFVACKR